MSRTTNPFLIISFKINNEVVLFANYSHFIYFLKGGEGTEKKRGGGEGGREGGKEGGEEGERKG